MPLLQPMADLTPLIHSALLQLSQAAAIESFILDCVGVHFQ